MITYMQRSGRLMELRCVQCGFPVKTLYVQYSEGNIRLMKCEYCKAVADEYIECELMILVIDLILHKPKAYRHLLYNVLNHESVHLEGLIWMLMIGFLFLDAYRSLVLRVSQQEQWSLSVSFSSVIWTCQKMLIDVFLGNFMFLCIFFLSMRVLSSTLARVFRYRHQLFAILVSSYFKIFLIFMMVWEFPVSVIFVIDMFVLSSNTVAMKVITGAGTNRCLAACFVAHAARLFVTHFSELKSLASSTIFGAKKPALY